jgi:hypothetical protein
MLYAADIFLSPPAVNRSLLAQFAPGECRERAVVKKLRSIQRRAALAITGALRSTPTDVLDAYANLLLVTHLIDKVWAGAALRLVTLLASHPIHAAVKQEVEWSTRIHSLPLYDLMKDFHLEPTQIEKIRAVQVPATWMSMMQVDVAPSKKEAQRREKDDVFTYRVYTDGSGIDGHIGGSAVLFVHGVEQASLQLHLGEDEHTVFEGEGIGGCLAMTLLL